ncbi:Zinc finger CCCH domain-containing protein 23 [Hibiscus syriacus]|uniref:Zinc finger CCCH domain-containing protein 23 n=1 Tax=Hibiscus syriacus TaxID=106335 RepID=A0A6A2W9P6_HIBSY|nr:Zinc finger CCCH domain-containing protein 23 [Hibiscus syriacus]
MVGETYRLNPTVRVPPWPDPDEDQTDVVYSPINAMHNISTDVRVQGSEVRSWPVHDWTECPYAHPGEKARRRDPRKYHYSGTACPDFRKGSCRKGDSCEFAHGVFECWLHPGRYRTQPCKDGLGCRRRVCFFAHTPDQLRVVTASSADSYDGSSPSCAKTLTFWSSPGSCSPPVSPRAESSPPVSPMAQSLSRSLGSASVNEMLTSLRNLQLEPVMERVESGRDLRAKMFEELSKENSLERVNPGHSAGAPDLDWVSDLVN